MINYSPPPLWYLGWIIIQIFVTCIGPLYNVYMVIFFQTCQPYMPWHLSPKSPPKTVNAHREVGWIGGWISKLKHRREGGPKSQNQCVWPPPPPWINILLTLIPLWYLSISFSWKGTTLYGVGERDIILFLVRPYKGINTHTPNII